MLQLYKLHFELEAKLTRPGLQSNTELKQICDHYSNV